jgi:Transposase and inactivated derivatives
VTLICQKAILHNTDEDHTACGLLPQLPHRVGTTVPPLETRHGEVADRVRTILHETADDTNLDILELTVQPDHIHWFVSRSSNTEPALLANWGNRLCSRKDTHRHADHDGETLGWARSYSVGTAGPAEHVSSEPLTPTS